MPSRERFRYRRSKVNKAQQQTKWKVWLWLLLGASVLAASVGGFFLVASDRKNNRGGYASPEEIEEVANQLNRKLKYLSIATPDPRATVALVDESGKSVNEKPMAQYVISIQDKYVGKVSVFDERRYKMNVLGDPTKIPDASGICKTIDRALEDKDEILKALQDADIRSQISATLWGVVDVGVEFTPPKVVQVEMAAVLRKILGIKAKKVEVLVKGYADGQRGPWKEKLLSHPYFYDYVSVYPPLEPERLNWFEFIRQETVIPIPGYYTNDELPDLRARFVKEDFVDRFLKDCGSATETKVHILKGQADKTNAIHPEDRKVQIYVNIY